MGYLINRGLMMNVLVAPEAVNNYSKTWILPQINREQNNKRLILGRFGSLDH